MRNSLKLSTRQSSALFSCAFFAVSVQFIRNTIQCLHTAVEVVCGVCFANLSNNWLCYTLCVWQSLFYCPEFIYFMKKSLINHKSCAIINKLQLFNFVEKSTNTNWINYYLRGTLFVKSVHSVSSYSWVIFIQCYG